MKNIKSLFAIVAALVALSVATPTFAADKGKEKTLKGELKCAKCCLKESDKCANVLEVKKDDGEKVMFYLADNQTSKDFHKNVCQEPKKVKVTGTTAKDGKKHTLTAEKIELTDAEKK